MFARQQTYLFLLFSFYSYVQKVCQREISGRDLRHVRLKFHNLLEATRGLPRGLGLTAYNTMKWRVFVDQWGTSSLRAKASRAKSWARAHVIRHMPAGRDKRESDQRLDERAKRTINTRAILIYYVVFSQRQTEGGGESRQRGRASARGSSRSTALCRVASDKETASIKTHFANVYHALLREILAYAM